MSSQSAGAVSVSAYVTGEEAMGVLHGRERSAGGRREGGKEG